MKIPLEFVPAKREGGHEKARRNFDQALSEAYSFAERGGNIGGENVDTTMLEDALQKLDLKYADLRREIEARGKAGQQEITLQ